MNSLKESADFQLIFENNEWVAGIDESGWGPIAGPLVAALVVLPKNIHIPAFIKDSKRLSDARRAEAYQWILQNAVYFEIASKQADVFSEHGAAFARESLFKELLERFNETVELQNIPSHYTLIDGSYAPPGSHRVLTVVRGDTKIPAISAASILAKVTRDAVMTHIADPKYPEFNWKSNKGYATKEHFEALEKYGATPLHRLNIKKVKDAKKYGHKATE